MAEQLVFSFLDPVKRKKRRSPTYKNGRSPRYAKIELTCRSCGKMVLRSPSKVRKRTYCSAPCRNAALRAGDYKPTGRPANKWTEDKIAILREHFAHLPNDELIKRFFPGMSRQGMCWRAHVLGLKKTKAAKRLALGHVYAANGKRNREKAAKPVAIECPICNEVFYRKPNYGSKRASGKQYCSRRCSHWAKTQIVGTGHPLYRRVETVCLWCEKTFIVKRTHALNPERGKFCSRECVGGYASSLQDGRRSSLEYAVEAELTNRKIEFIPQKKMAQFVCDFYLPDRKLVIECDGKYWHSIPKVAARDKRKDAWLTSHGQKIVRLGEDEINTDCKAAVDRALAA